MKAIEKLLRQINLMIDAIEGSTVLKTYDPGVRQRDFEDLRYLVSKLGLAVGVKTNPRAVSAELETILNKEIADIFRKQFQEQPIEFHPKEDDRQKPVLIIRPPILHPTQYEELYGAVNTASKSFEVIVIPKEYSVTAFIDGQFKNLDSDGDV